MFSVIFPGQGSQSVGMAKDLYNKFDFYEAGSVLQTGSKNLSGKIKLDSSTVRSFCSTTRSGTTCSGALPAATGTCTPGRPYRRTACASSSSPSTPRQTS